MYTSITKKYNVDANLDASDNVISGNEPSSEMLTSPGHVGWLCFTSRRKRGHLETAPPFTVPYEGREARFLHRLHRQSNPGSLHGSPLRNRCATPALAYTQNHGVQV